MDMLSQIIIPLTTTSFILFVTMFAHLKFDLVATKTIQIICAGIGGLYGFLYFTNMYSLIVEYNVFLSTIHYTNLCLFLLYPIVIGFYSRRITPNLLQIIGLCIFGVSGYFLLA